MKSIPQFHGLSGTKNGFFTGQRPFRTHSHLHKHLCHTVTGIKIIVYHQSLQSLQLCDLFFTMMFRLNTQCQTDNKFTALPLLSLNINGTAHHIHNVFGDSHAKSRTLDPADCRSPLTFKW